LDEVLMKENATAEEIAAALKQEAEEKEPEQRNLSDDPITARLQQVTDMPKTLAEAHSKRAKPISPRRS
jgi:hypothetical protein